MKAPANSEGCVGCRNREVIAEVRLVVEGAVALDVGARWKEGRYDVLWQVRGILR